LVTGRFIDRRWGKNAGREQDITGQVSMSKKKIGGLIVCAIRRTNKEKEKKPIKYQQKKGKKNKGW